MKEPPRMGTHNEGPWRGQWNGDRVYNVNMGDQKIPVGSFHLIRGCKVKIVYQGNIPTCGRCHQHPNQCPGKGVARECKERGGPWVPLMSHMRRIWDYVNSPPEQAQEKPNPGEVSTETPGELESANGVTGEGQD